MGQKLQHSTNKVSSLFLNSVYFTHNIHRPVLVFLGNFLGNLKEENG